MTYLQYKIFSVICHELAHMILYNIYGNQRGILRHSDFYSRKGDSKNFASQEVHDRIFERKLRTISIYRNRFKKFRFIGVDILDLCFLMNCRHKVLIRFTTDLYICVCCDEEFDIKAEFVNN